MMYGFFLIFLELFFSLKSFQNKKEGATDESQPRTLA